MVNRNPLLLPLLVSFALLCGWSLTACNSSAEQGAKHSVADNVVPVSTDSAARLELKTESVVRRELATQLHVTGRIQAEVSKEIDVSPRFSGRVTEILVKMGDPVQGGQTMAKVDSPEVNTLQAELIEAQSKLEIAKAQEERERQICEEHLQRPKDLLAAQSANEQLKVQVQLAEAEYKRTEDLFKEKIASAKDFQATKAALSQLKVQLHESDALLQREQRLFKNTALLKRDLQLAHAEMLREKQHVNTLRQRLILLGLPPAMVASVMSTGKIVASVPIVSPAAGHVTDQKMAVGEMVSPDKRFIMVTDLTTVVMSAEVPEVDVRQIRLGAPVDIKVAAFPEEKFSGSISFVSDFVNPTTRTIAIRATLPNPDRRLKTNMFAEIDLPGAPRTALAVPKAAVQERAGAKVVYVATGNGYAERRIEVGKDFGQYFEAISGLAEGDQVATQGSLLLRTAMTNKQTTQQ